MRTLPEGRVYARGTRLQRASGAGITRTVRTGLELVAASATYARLRQLRGKVRFTRSSVELKADR